MVEERLKLAAGPDQQQVLLRLGEDLRGNDATEALVQRDMLRGEFQPVLIPEEDQPLGCDQFQFQLLPDRFRSLAQRRHCHVIIFWIEHTVDLRP